MLLNDRGVCIRLGTLTSHGPFQDLLAVLSERQQILADGVLDADTPEELAKAQKEARGFRDALDYIRSLTSDCAETYKKNVVPNVTA